MGRRLLWAIDLIKVLNKMAGSVSGRVFVRRRCIEEAGVSFNAGFVSVAVNSNHSRLQVAVARRDGVHRAADSWMNRHDLTTSTLFFFNLKLIE